MTTIQDYVAKTPSGQAQVFAEWVITETGLTFKTKAAQDAFERGLYLGVRGYKLFQAANREAGQHTSTTKPRRTRKAAATIEDAA